jgi:hypothetical protein
VAKKSSQLINKANQMVRLVSRYRDMPWFAVNKR